MRLVLIIALAAATAACSASPEDEMENFIRENLAARGNVQDVQLTAENENRMTGFAVLRDAHGEGRLDCTAERAQGTTFNWRCAPVVDERTINEVESEIRTQLSNQGTVEEVSLARRDNDSLAGHALVLSPDGERVRTACAATRDPASGNLNWECNPEGSAPGGK